MSSYPWKRSGKHAHLVVVAGSIYFTTACAVLLEKSKVVDAHPDDERCLPCNQASFPLEYPDLYAQAKQLISYSIAVRAYHLQRVLSINHDQAKAIIEAMIADRLIEEKHNPILKGYLVLSDP